MAQLDYWFFDSTDDDERELSADDFAAWLQSFVTSGIRNGGTCLEVTPGNGLTVNVDNGIGNVLGYVIRLTEDIDGRFYNVALPPAHPQYPRIDRIVLRLDRRKQTRYIKPMVAMGTASATPQPPDLTRNNEIWELSLAQVRVNDNATEILPTDIKDERFYTELCGLMNSVLGLDPSAWQRQFDYFFSQLQKHFDSKKTEWELRFDDFLNTQTNLGYISMDSYNKIAFGLFEAIVLPSLFKMHMPASTGNTITQQIIHKLTSEIVAQKVVTKNSNSITETVTIYKAAGLSSDYTISRTTTRNADGSIDVV